VDIDPLLGELDPLVIPRRQPPRNEAEAIPRSDVAAIQPQDTSTRREPSSWEYLEARGSQRGRGGRRGRPRPRPGTTRAAAANAERAAVAGAANSEAIGQLAAVLHDVQSRVAAALPGPAYVAPPPAPVLAYQTPSAAAPSLSVPVPPGLIRVAPPPAPILAYQTPSAAAPGLSVSASPGLLYVAPPPAPVLTGQAPPAASARGGKQPRGGRARMHSHEQIIEF
jgi:hypothetical protein